jgi:uncharacterized protein with von Willebrand factor type A (vWA) domain
MAGDALVRHVVAFGRVLRAAGLDVGPGRVAEALAGLDNVEIGSREDVYWALRLTLVSKAGDIELFDRAFEAWFMRVRRDELPRREEPTAQATAENKPGAREVDPEPEAGEGDDTPGWSAGESLRDKDFASMTPAELAELRKLMRKLAARRPLRRSRRLRRHQRGDILDMRRLIRASLATGGDPLDRTFRKRLLVPRRLVVICDVSGSMEAYARALLLFVHAAVGAGKGVEAFVFGTRLTRLTSELKVRDPEQAFDAASARVVDWSGGTRIGASLKAYNDEWGRRALTRGAVVVIVSDGWERDNAALVGTEMARLQRQAYATVWVNPLKGSPEYQPLAGGMRAALPYIDRFLPGHNLAALEELADVLSGIERRHAA